VKRELIVGMVFAILLALLVGATVWIDKPGFFKKEPEHVLDARFREVAGLKVGDEVWVYGTPAGEVLSITPNGQGEVDVRLAMDYDPKMRENAEVKISQRSALGGAVVSIHPGTADRPLSKESVFAGLAVADPFQEISTAVAEVKGPIVDAFKKANDVLDDLAKRSDSVTENLDKTLENARAITDDVRAGKGTLGKLVNDAALYDELKSAIEGIRKIGDDAAKGGGTIDMLLHDKAVAADLKATVANARTISQDLAAGKGTLGRLLHDDTLYTRLDEAVTSFTDIAKDARSGKGVLGKLIYDEALAKRFDTISEDVAQVTGKLRRGEGTLGKLIQDESVFNDLKSTLRNLGGGVEDVRENAPVLTFAAFLFSGF
jgi:phospholipid/cholesterol/gamma-HCH transport system substrate-binding protein